LKRFGGFGPDDQVRRRGRGFDRQDDMAAQIVVITALNPFEALFDARLDQPQPNAGNARRGRIGIAQEPAERANGDDSQP
jgi:hypothetical protein